MVEEKVDDFPYGDKSGSVEANAEDVFRVVNGKGTVIAEIIIPKIKAQNLRFHYSIMVRGELLREQMTGDEYKEARSQCIDVRTASIKEAIKP